MTNTLRYEGERTSAGCKVWRVGARRTPLPMRLNLENKSPTGFEWGYGGSGPSQLALAILADALGDDDMALRLYQRFKWDVVCKLPHTGWTLSRAEVLATVELIHATPMGAVND